LDQLHERIHWFVTCSLVKSLTLIVGWPHLLFGHPLTRICLVKKTLVASQVSYHLCSKLCPPGHVGDSRGSFPDGHRLPLAVQLPYPILHSASPRAVQVVTFS
uniref:Uncharacterized protein n=1 Tax=Sus scrofa TaxID=9823 RepID=A0A8D1CFQ2_PIG